MKKKELMYLFKLNQTQYFSVLKDAWFIRQSGEALNKDRDFSDSEVQILRRWFAAKKEYHAARFALTRGMRNGEKTLKLLIQERMN